MVSWSATDRMPERSGSGIPSPNPKADSRAAERGILVPDHADADFRGQAFFLKTIVQVGPAMHDGVVQRRRHLVVLTLAQQRASRREDGHAFGERRHGKRPPSQGQPGDGQDGHSFVGAEKDPQERFGPARRAMPPGRGPNQRARRRLGANHLGSALLQDTQHGGHVLLATCSHGRNRRFVHAALDHVDRQVVRCDVGRTEEFLHHGVGRCVGAAAQRPGAEEHARVGQSDRDLQAAAPRALQRVEHFLDGGQQFVGLARFGVRGDLGCPERRDGHQAGRDLVFAEIQADELADRYSGEQGSHGVAIRPSRLWQPQYRRINDLRTYRYCFQGLALAHVPSVQESGRPKRRPPAIVFSLPPPPLWRRGERPHTRRLNSSSRTEP